MLQLFIKNTLQHLAWDYLLSISKMKNKIYLSLNFSYLHCYKYLFFFLLVY